MNDSVQPSPSRLSFSMRFLKRLHKKLRQSDNRFQRLLAGYQSHIDELSRSDYPEECIRPSQHAFFWLSAAFCFFFVVWACFFKLDVVNSAPGEVNPYGQVKKIQHLEGGIVKHILVKEGQSVSAGQALVELALIQSSADVAELNASLASLQMEIFRLQAHADGLSQLSFPAEFESSHAVLVGQSVKLFSSQLSRHESDVVAADEFVAQRQEEVVKVKGRLKNLQEELLLLNEQVGMSRDLLKDGITSRYDHLSLLQQQKRLMREIGEGRSSVNVAIAAFEEAKAQLEQVRHRFTADSRDDLQEAQRQFDEFSQRLLKLEDSLQRTTLRSPVDGIIKLLNVVAAGEVVKAGDTVAEIVPSDELIVETFFKPRDIGYIREGQLAYLRLTSSDAVRFGVLNARVERISPDTFVDKNSKQPSYKVRIKPDENFFSLEGRKYYLMPGVEVEVSILIGQRTIMAYLLEPIVGGAQRALREM